MKLVKIKEGHEAWLAEEYHVREGMYFEVYRVAYGKSKGKKVVKRYYVRHESKELALLPEEVKVYN